MRSPAAERAVESLMLVVSCLLSSRCWLVGCAVQFQSLPDQSMPDQRLRTSHCPTSGSLTSGCRSRCWRPGGVGPPDPRPGIAHPGGAGPGGVGPGAAGPGAAVQLPPDQLLYSCFGGGHGSGVEGLAEDILFAGEGVTIGGEVVGAAGLLRGCRTGPGVRVLGGIPRRTRRWRVRRVQVRRGRRQRSTRRSRSRAGRRRCG